ncbi:MAG: hypothetical protein HQ567_29440 [Candidatus Nealsonbacteria bacterium]|nr:hypothetical protein [Candidatus Nealsonbacteria bacterium]
MTEAASLPCDGMASDRRHVAVVTTTIHVPRFLDELLTNARHHGHAGQVSCVVVGDRKTPADVAKYLAELARRHTAEVTYLDVPAQQKLLRRWPSLDLFVRYDCIQRRNVGYLQAAIDGAEVIVSVDDDNFVTDDDFIGSHLVVGRQVEVPVLSHPSGWWNICERLVCDPPRQFYHRGYPKSRQDFRTGGYELTTASVRAVVNAGLWLGVPDADATAHLEEPLHVAALEPIGGQRTCALAAGTWCPVNSQNTAFDASLLPAMYLPVMLDPVRGYRIGRMDDIWMSYFVRAIADRQGDAVTGNDTVLYGPPLVTQKRNPHDHLADLTEELAGYLLTERLVEYLRRFDTAETTYAAAYLDLIYHLRDAAETDAKLDRAEREYFRLLTLGMAAWHGAVAEIVGRG